MVQVEPVHLAGLVVSLLLFYQSLRLLRTRQERVIEFLLWAGSGAVIFTLSLGDIITLTGVMASINSLLKIVGFNSGEKGIFMLTFLCLLIVILYGFNIMMVNKQKIIDLNQEIALLRYEQVQNDKESNKQSSEEECELPE